MELLEREKQRKEDEETKKRHFEELEEKLSKI
jgi:hypothetical protein